MADDRPPLKSFVKRPPLESFGKSEATNDKPQDGTIFQFLKDAAGNVPGSAGKAVENIAEPFIHPLDTAESFIDLGKGIAQYLGMKGGTDFEKYPDAVGRFFAERYGGIDNVLNTIKTDPVGFAMDASVILSGGGTLGVKLPGMAGEVASTVANVGRAVDPLVAAGKVAKGATAVGTQLVGKLGTYTGEKPIQLAFSSAKEGGEARKAFLSNLRNQAPKDAIVLDARNAVANIRKERGKAYREGMVGVKADAKPLEFNDVDAAISEMEKVSTFRGASGKGPVQNISEGTEAIRSELKGVINDWKALDKQEFHTPEGFDALKKKIGEIRDGKTEVGTPARLVADQAYQAVRQTIINQNHEYAKIMHGYEAAEDLIKQMEKELNVNRNAPIGTTLRKLQSVLRDNVNTGYGYRAELADILVNAGAPHLLEAIAGQAMQSWTPRGLGALAQTAEVSYGVLSAYNHDMNDLIRAAVLLGLSSPRLMGEAASAAGTVAHFGPPARDVGQGAFQAGRVPPITESAAGAQGLK